MIKVLDSFIADKIAAGEVIERPVSAVKELIENSIDAGAGAIIIEIRNGGKSYIRVTDDGCGIPSDEAATAFLRHATSKISSVTDLDNIRSLGFRGEALASISAVSRLTLVTRTADDIAGTKLTLHGGKVISNESVGANTGTTIIVEDLFYNTPARRKFMKSDAREASSIIDIVQQYAVYYTNIRFKMVSNGQTVFTTKGDGDTKTAVKYLYPDLAGFDLIPVSSESVNGLVSDPGTTLTGRKGQLFFVNGRLVSSPVIEKGLEDGYNGRIFSGYPIAVIFIDADPHDIDVNIHPGKREIRFLKQDEIRKSISEAVSAAVMTERGIPEAIPPSVHPTPLHNIERALSRTDDVKDSESHIEDGSELIQWPDKLPSEQPSIRDYLTNLERDTETEIDSTSQYSDPVSYVSEEFSEYKPTNSFDFSDLVLKGYVFDTYIIMQGRGSLYIFDQHAAHERVFYEKFMRGYKNSSHIPQSLLTPFTFYVSADVYFMDRDWLNSLLGMGYDIEDFGDRTFIVRGIPAFMEPGEAKLFVTGFAEAVDESGNAVNQTVIDKLIMKSCKSAVKANDKLSELEISELINKLAACDNPYSCPHGRPTFIKITSYDIEKWFRRK